jgi:LysM repeat protein
MIPLVLAGVGFGLVAYFIDRKIRHRPVTLKGALAAGLVAGLTGFVGGPALDSLWAAGVFASEGAVAAEVGDHLAPTKKAPPAPGSEGGAAGSSMTAASQDPAPDDTHGGIYAVQSGDTIYSIAKRAGVSQSSLRMVNPQVGADNEIRVGEELTIPCPNIDTAGPGAPQSAGCAVAIERAFSQKPNSQNSK